MDITKDIRPLTEFKRETTRFLARLRDTGRPAVLTVNGKPALVVMEAAAWQRQQEQLEFALTVADIGKGLEQARRGEGTEAGEFFETIGAGKA